MHVCGPREECLLQLRRLKWISYCEIKLKFDVSSSLIFQIPFILSFFSDLITFVKHMNDFVFVDYKTGISLQQ